MLLGKVAVVGEKSSRVFLYLLNPHAIQCKASNCLTEFISVVGLVTLWSEKWRKITLKFVAIFVVLVVLATIFE